MKVNILAARTTPEGKVTDQVVGTYTLADGVIAVEGERELLASILKTPAVEPETGTVYASGGDPERWLQNLQYSLRSAYLRAEAPS